MTKKSLFAFAIIASTLLIFTCACKHDPVVATIPGCDTINVTFSETVNPIIQQNCLTCHSNANPSAGISLEGYDNVAAVANSGVLMGVIHHNEGYTPMPPDSDKLSDCKITQTQKWIDDGTPNN